MLEFLQTFPNERWDDDLLSENPNMTLQMMKSYPQKCWRYMLYNVNVPTEVAYEHIIQHDIFGCDLSASSNITVQFIREHPEYSWDWQQVTIHKHIKCEDIFNNLDLPWVINMITHNPNVTPDVVKQHPEIHWDFHALSLNENMQWADVQYFHDKNWNYNFLSQHLPLEIIEGNIGGIWLWVFVSNNVNMNIEFILKYGLIQNVCWMSLSFNPGIRWIDIQSTPHLPWIPKYVSMNANVTMDIVEANPEYPWDYTMMSNNPNLTAAFVKKNEDKQWCWTSISENEFHFSLHWEKSVTVREARRLALIMSSHTRLGSQSAVRVLPKHLLRQISFFI